MLWAIIALFLLGLALEGLFSGAETGLYRVPRVRLMVDAVGGDLIARGLLWLAANPPLFVATTQVGNNIANYMISLATVMAAARLFPAGGIAAEVLLPIVLTPMIFVYGELLPKNLFLKSPVRLLRTTGPVILLATILFLPVSALIWGASKLLEWFLGESPPLVLRRLARTELKRVFEEGQEAGLLRPSQRTLAHGLLDVARLTVRSAMIPASRIAAVGADDSKEEILRQARRRGATALPVESRERPREPIGYIRVVDLYLGHGESVGPVRPLQSFRDSEPHITALVRLQTSGEPLARVIDAAGRTIGYITPEQLHEPLFRVGA